MRGLQIFNFARAAIWQTFGLDGAYQPRFGVIGHANRQTVNFLKTTGARTIAEIGVYRGGTSIELANWLNGEGELHLYDFHDRLAAVSERLNSFSNVKYFGNSYKLLDSYNWSLARQLERHPEPIYDYVFIDGSHIWNIDGFAFLLIDRLLKPGGYVDFDDYEWTIDLSPSNNKRVFPFNAKLHTDEQMTCTQVKMIVDLLVRRDKRYKEVVPNKIFQKATLDAPE